MTSHVYCVFSFWAKFMSDSRKPAASRNARIASVVGFRRKIMTAPRSQARPPPSLLGLWERKMHNGQVPSLRGMTDDGGSWRHKRPDPPHGRHRLRRRSADPAAG